MEPSTWTWLEVVKLAVAVATPVAVVLIGMWVNKRVKRLEDAQWTRQTLIERRMKVYDEMASDLNDLLVFFRLFGHFRDVEPPQAVELKRKLDKAFLPNKSLFSQDFAGRYDRFTEACFKTYNQPGGDALLRASRSRQHAERNHVWEAEWDSMFVDEGKSPVVAADLPKGSPPPKDPQATIVEKLYWRLMRAFAHELGMADEPIPPTRKFQGSFADVQNGRPGSGWHARPGPGEFEPVQPVQVRDGSQWSEGWVVEYEATTSDDGDDATTSTGGVGYVRLKRDGKVRQFFPADLRPAPPPDRKGSRW